MTGDVIKSFLVGLGFGVDDASLSKFNKAIASATLRVSALYGSVNLASAGILKGVSDISQGFEQMGYEYRIIAPAINKALVLRRELLKAYSAAGINITKVVQNSVKLNYSLAKTKFAFEAIYKSVASRFFETITKQSDIFRKKIYDNMPKIQDALERLVKFIFKALDAVTTLGSRLWSILTRVYDFFRQLHEATDGWSTAIIAAGAAWKILNLGFLATPLGMLIAGFVTLLALWDDFKTFKEGGQSLINWGSDTTKMIVGMTAAVAGLTAAIVSLVTVYNLFTNAAKIATAAQAAFNIIMSLNPIGLVVLAVTALIAGLTALDAKWNLFGGHVTGFFTSLGGKVLDFLGGSNTATNLQTGVPKASPLSPGQTSNTNQNVQQQTNINVTGSADASSVGKAVSSEQSKVNFDMVRNLKGATR